MKVISYNINGIRSAKKKGFVSWVNATQADILCLQETKASLDDVDMSPFVDMGYEVLWFEGERKGYSGVSILTKLPVDSVEFGIGNEKFDREARFLKVKHGDLAVMTTYVPSGSNPLRHAFKMEWLGELQEALLLEQEMTPEIILCGDFNICHSSLDLHNPRALSGKSGFLPEEQDWMDEMINAGFLDAFRYFNAEPHHYTWWPHPRAKENNLGLRLDYFLVTRSLENRLTRASHLTKTKHSDHCAIVLELT